MFTLYLYSHLFLHSFTPQNLRLRLRFFNSYQLFSSLWILSRLFSMFISSSYLMSSCFFLLVYSFHSLPLVYFIIFFLSFFSFLFTQLFPSFCPVIYSLHPSYIHLFIFFPHFWSFLTTVVPFIFSSHLLLSLFSPLLFKYFFSFFFSFVSILFIPF